jgi:hypothetical protein
MTPADRIAELEILVAQLQAVVAQLREQVSVLLAENQAVKECT